MKYHSSTNTWIATSIIYKYANLHTPIIVKGSMLHFPDPKHLCLEKAVTMLVSIQTILLMAKKCEKSWLPKTPVCDVAPKCLKII